MKFTKLIIIARILSDQKYPKVDDDRRLWPKSQKIAFNIVIGNIWIDTAVRIRNVGGEIPPNIEVESENFKTRAVRSIDYEDNESIDINAIQIYNKIGNTRSKIMIQIQDIVINHYNLYLKRESNIAAFTSSLRENNKFLDRRYDKV